MARASKLPMHGPGICTRITQHLDALGFFCATLMSGSVTWLRWRELSPLGIHSPSADADGPVESVLFLWLIIFIIFLIIAR